MHAYARPGDLPARQLSERGRHSVAHKRHALEPPDETCSNAPVPSPDPPPVIADLAQSCVRFVKEALDIELDFTPDTLPVLDHYVRAKVGAATEEVVALLAPATGAYFGEVVRRAFEGARWHTPGDAYPSYRLEFEPFYLCFNPIGVAVEVLTHTNAGAWNAHFGVLDEARAPLDRTLHANPAIREDDYYTFSVRMEVLEQVTGLLGALESRVGARRRTFGPDVYRAASGEHGGRGEA